MSAENDPPPATTSPSDCALGAAPTSRETLAPTATITGTYGTQSSLVFPLIVSALALVGHVWHHSGNLQWPEIVWLAGILAQVLIRWPFMRVNRGNNIIGRRVDLQEKLLLGAAFFTMVVLPMLYVGTPLFDAFNYSLPTFAPWLGALLLLPATWLFWRSHADLGRNWSPSLEVREGHHIVDSGVYKRIRHPMYVAIWLYAIAQVLLIRNWIAGALVIPAFAALYFLRVPREESMMLDTFGEDYRRYMNRTGRLIPKRTDAAKPPSNE